MNALGLLLGFVADRLFGDPQRWHPVAGFGRLAARHERHAYADSRAAGVRHTATLVGGAALVGWLLDRGSRRSRAARVAVTAVCTWAVLGGRTLEYEAGAVGDLLAADDVPGARQRLTHLVGRRTTELTEAEIARAVVESVAENTSDAVVAPLFWGAVAGPPGLLAYRASNTLDAMVGHRTQHYANFGWASATLDDLLNLPGSRLSAALVWLSSPGRRGAVWQAWRRDAPTHPSPNAGVVEAAFAGSLDVTLGGENHYPSGTEHRVRMGTGAAPLTCDIAAANRLASRVGWLAVTAAVVSNVRLALRPQLGGQGIEAVPTPIGHLTIGLLDAEPLQSTSVD